VFALLTVFTLVVFALGVWNPWHLAKVTYYFGNPSAGAVWVLAFTLVAVWLLTPVTVEARQNRRLWLRFLLGALLLLAVGFYGVFGNQFFTGNWRVVATSADGQRALVEITRFEDRELRIWTGTGWAARDAGRLGVACGEVAGRFDGTGRVHVSSVYGEFDLRLDPRTGRPLDTIATCSG
jgi:hypothetical protein